jgi:uncharacterized protein with GYD domain
MRPRSILLALSVTFGLALPAVAQQSSSPHRYVTLFKFTDQAVKNLTDNPQDRTAAVSKTAEQFGGKLESLLLFPNSGEFDGLAIMQMPSDAAMEEVNLVIRSSGSFTRLQVTPVLTPAEFKSMLEAAKQGAPSYAAPGK